MAKTIEQIAHEWTALVTRPGITAAELDAVHVGGDRASAYGRGGFFYSGNVSAPVAALVPGVTVAALPLYHGNALPEGAAARVPVFVARQCTRQGFCSRDYGGNALAGLRNALSLGWHRVAPITGAMVALPDGVDVRAVLGAGESAKSVSEWAAAVALRATATLRSIENGREHMAYRCNALRDYLATMRDPGSARGRNSYLSAAELAGLRHPGVRAFVAGLRQEYRARFAADTAEARRWRAAWPLVRDGLADDVPEATVTATARVAAIRAALRMVDWRDGADKRAQSLRLVRSRIAAATAALPGMESAAALAAASLARDGEFAAIDRATLAPAIAEAVAALEASQTAGEPQDAIARVDRIKRDAKRAGVDVLRVPGYKAARLAIKRARPVLTRVASLAAIVGDATMALRAVTSAPYGAMLRLRAQLLPQTDARIAALLKARDMSARIADCKRDPEPAREYRARIYGELNAAHNRAVDANDRARMVAASWPDHRAAADDFAAWNGTPSTAEGFDPAAAVARTSALVTSTRQAMTALAAEENAKARERIAALLSMVASNTAACERGDYAAVDFAYREDVRIDPPMDRVTCELHSTLRDARRAFDHAHGNALQDWEAINAIAAWRAGASNRALPYNSPTALRFRDSGTRVETSRGAVVGAHSAERLYRAWRIARQRGTFAAIVGQEVAPYHVNAANYDYIIIGCHRIEWAEAEAFGQAANW